MKVKVINQEELLNTGFLKVDKYTLEQPLADGNTIQYQRQCMFRGNAVAIVPYDKKRECVVMINQIRIANVVDGGHSPSLEFPAGMIDEGEDPLQSATRELYEETGLEALNIEQTYSNSIYTTAGASNEKMYYFLAEVDSSKVLATTGEIGQHEYIETCVIPVQELFKMAFEDNSLLNASTIINTFILKSKINND
ncbi:MAG: NUDIX hydrolase [Alphaproteobacteria bacterium]|nr:NUDIX hydrolase [Alphaproteobacteria bacterium]